MRLNLNVRNASSTSFNNNTFTINFNVSKFIKFQQLNENARIYIESVNLIDITDTNLNAKIEGNIEIRCDFITNDDFSTSNDNNPLLFNNTLYQSETIRNNNSMYNMNYKCNTNAFRSGNINLYIKFHDNVGKILKDVSFINTAHAGYATYLADLAALNLKAGEIVAQEAVVEAQNNIILNDQTFVDNFENMKNIKDIDVDIARRELRSQVLVKLNASVVSGGNRPIWVALLAFISDVNNSDLDVYNYYNFPVGEHLRPSGSNTFFIDHYNPYLREVEAYESINDQFLKSFFALENIKTKTTGGIVNLTGAITLFTGQSVLAQLKSDIVQRTYSCARGATPTVFFNIELIITAQKDILSVVYVSDQSTTSILSTDILNIERTSLINIKGQNSTTDPSIPFLTLTVASINTAAVLLQPKIFILNNLQGQIPALSTALFASKAAVTQFNQITTFLQESIKGLSINLNLYQEVEKEFETDSSTIKNNNMTRSKDCYFKRF